MNTIANNIPHLNQYGQVLHFEIFNSTLPARNALALVSMLNITFIHYSITITFIAPRHFEAGGSFFILIFAFYISFGVLMTINSSSFSVSLPKRSLASNLIIL